MLVSPTDPLAPAQPPGSGGVGEEAPAGLRFTNFGPWGRRRLIAGLGAACALGLGAATAYAVRLPEAVQTADAPRDQMLLQDEPPSVTAARANALHNPPDYRPRPSPDLVQIDNPHETFDADDAADADASPDLDRAADDGRTTLEPTSPTDAVHAENPRLDKVDRDETALETGRPAS